MIPITNKIIVGLFITFISCLQAHAAFEKSGLLEIHYINVGQGGSTLIIGPNGTRILYDFGKSGGKRYIIPYLKNKVGIQPEDGLHYTIVSHNDTDHYKGFRDLIDDKYRVHVANYSSGSNKPVTDSLRNTWLNPAKKTVAGKVRPIPVGLNISLGDGAELIVMAANGKVYGEQKRIPVPNENDRSIALLIRYGNFHYILDGDLGSGTDIDCTPRDTHQRDVQTPVARALIRQGLVNPEHGVDVLHIAHHGSESSTGSEYYNLMKPQVGLVSVGFKQGSFKHPRKIVVEKVLLDINRPDCVTAPAVELLLQTEDGKPTETDTCEHCTSNAGLSVGNIRLTTDGIQSYTLKGDNQVANESAKEGCVDHTTSSDACTLQEWVCTFDEKIQPGQPACQAQH